MRHLKTVRTHLLWLVNHDKVSAEEDGTDFTIGLTEEVWKELNRKGQVSFEIPVWLSLFAKRKDSEQGEYSVHFLVQQYVIRKIS